MRLQPRLVGYALTSVCLCSHKRVHATVTVFYTIGVANNYFAQLLIFCYTELDSMRISELKIKINIITSRNLLKIGEIVTYKEK